MSNSRACDLATVLKACVALRSRFSDVGFEGKSNAQSYVFGLLEEYAPVIEMMEVLRGMASEDVEELNDFLEEGGFPRLLEPFGRGEGVGFVGILDMVFEWLGGPGTDTTIYMADGNERDGFKLGENASGVFALDDFPMSPLVQLSAATGECVWLLLHPDTTLDGLDMFELARAAMASDRRISQNPRGEPYIGVEVPNIQLSVRKKLQFMMGAQIQFGGQSLPISQAEQVVQFTLSRLGASVKAAAAMSAERSLRNTAFTVDRPFYGWVTMFGSDMPIAPCFFDYDCME